MNQPLRPTLAPAVDVAAARRAPGPDSADPTVPRDSPLAPWERPHNVIGRYRQTAGGWAAVA